MISGLGSLTAPTLLAACGLAFGIVLCASPWMPATPTHEASLPGIIRQTLAAAGLTQVPAAAVIPLSLLLAIVAGGIALLIVPVVGVAALSAVAGAVAPWMAISWRARSRRAQRADVWADVTDHLVAGVRSGLALPDALALLVEHGPAELRDDIKAFSADYRATGSFGYALDRLKERFSDPTADRIVETLRMAREVGGGEVAGVLSDLGGYLRAAQATRGELAARQSWVVGAARLGVVAPWIVLLMLSSRPEAASSYNSPTGFAIIATGAVVTVLAYRIMLAVGRLPEEGRWFA